MGTRITEPRKGLEITPGVIDLAIHPDGRRFPLAMPKNYDKVHTRILPTTLLRLRGVENAKGEQCIINTSVKLIWGEFLNLFYNRDLSATKPEECSISENNLAKSLGLRSNIVVREGISILYNLGILKMVWDTERCKNNKGEMINRRVNVRYLDILDPSGELANNWPDDLKIL